MATTRRRWMGRKMIKGEGCEGGRRAVSSLGSHHSCSNLRVSGRDAIFFLSITALHAVSRDGAAPRGRFRARRAAHLLRHYRPAWARWSRAAWHMHMCHCAVGHCCGRVLAVPSSARLTMTLLVALACAPAAVAVPRPPSWMVAAPGELDGGNGG